MLLSIIIIEYNSRKDVEICVEQIVSRVKVPIEIIITSNSCYSARERHDIEDSLKGVRWIFNERNGGFAYAMNMGMRAAKGDLMVIMNPDCTVVTDLTGMVSFILEHPDVGAVAPRVCDACGEIQDTARRYVTLPRILHRFLRRVLCDKDRVYESGMDYGAVQTVDWVVGAFIMVSRKAYELTRGLDSGYFMYAEDLDWCTRIRRAGLEVVYYPKDVVVFKGTRRARHELRFALIFLKSHLRYWLRFGFMSIYPRRSQMRW